jgi:hypothetical protein
MSIPKLIYPKDLVKGDKVFLKNGWRADVLGKARGTIILLKVYGHSTDIGDTYTRELGYRENADGKLDRIIIEPKHEKKFAAIKAAGF